MKRFVLFALLTISPAIMLMAGEKVLESSQRKAPKWLYGMEKGYIITNAEARTLEGAREEAMLLVKERVLTSIAENVRTEARHDVTETVHNGEIESISQFAKQVRTRAAEIPYLSSISESKVESYYWEKVQLDKTTIVYRYNIRYPLPEIEVRFLVKAFKEDQARINSDIEAIKAVDFSTFASVEQMAEPFAKLKSLQAELSDEDPRRESCRAAQTHLQQQLANLRWVVLASDKNETTMMLYYGEHPVSCNQRLTLRSNCLTQIRYTSAEQQVRVSYNSDGCYADEDNYLDVTLMVGSRKVSEKVMITIQ